MIPFPCRKDVLINQVASFDLVVFEEFNYAQYGLLPSLIAAIRQKVLDGGAFLLMGGPIAFGEEVHTRSRRSPILLPVQIGTPQVRTLKEPAKLILKAPSHPIVRLDEKPERNQAIWQALPALDDVTLLGDAKPGAQVLATAKGDGKRRSGACRVAVRQKARCRSFVGAHRVALVHADGRVLRAAFRRVSEVLEKHGAVAHALRRVQAGARRA